jgi:hypothetical protein
MGYAVWPSRLRWIFRQRQRRGVKGQNRALRMLPASMIPDSYILAEGNLFLWSYRSKTCVLLKLMDLSLMSPDRNMLALGCGSWIYEWPDEEFLGRLGEVDGGLMKNRALKLGLAYKNLRREVQSCSHGTHSSQMWSHRKVASVQKSSF